MADLKRLPVGLDDFKKIRENKFYYIDKTMLIEQLLENWGEVNLFTRPQTIWQDAEYEHVEGFF